MKPLTDTDVLVVSIIAASLLSVGAYLGYFRRKVRKHVEAVFGPRTELSEKDVVESFRGTGASAVIVGRVLRAVAVVVPVGKLRPGDRFDEELHIPPTRAAAPWRIITGILYRFNSLYGKEYPGFKAPAEVLEAATLGDFVRLLAKALEAESPAR
jgi:hypothetical protein